MPARRARGKWWRRALLAGLALIAALLTLEGVLRAVLFSESLRDSAPAEKLRRAPLFASPSSADFWKLHVLFRRPHFTSKRHRGFDARTGWLADEIDAATLAHADEPRLAGRRPVLFFGDSFAQCVDRAGDCWEELLEASDLAPRFALLTSGVGGYGLDQMLVLLRLVLPRFEGRSRRSSPDSGRASPGSGKA